MGDGPGLNAAWVAIQDRVLLLLWVIGWCWAWYGSRSVLPAKMWCQQQRLTNVDAAAAMAAVGMLAFSFAPSYTFDSSGETSGFLGSGGGGINAWHESTTAVPVALVVAVAVLLVLRAVVPVVPAVLVRVATRIVLLVADLVMGWALFNPSDEVFDTMHYGWGMWAMLACLVAISVLAMNSPPRLFRWLIE